MKKVLGLLVILLILFTSCANQKDDYKSLNQTTSKANTRLDLDARIQKLVENNIKCVTSIFSVKGLKCIVTDVAPDDSIYQVDSEEFPDFQSLKDFIQNTYIKVESDRLL